MGLRIRAVRGDVEIEIDCQDTDQLESVLSALDKHPEILAASATDKFAINGTEKASGLHDAPTQTLRQGGQEGIAETSGAGAVTRIDPKTGVVIMTAKLPPASSGEERIEDALLILLLGYEQKGQVPANGTWLMMSLRQTGYTGLNGIADYMDDLSSMGLVLVSGAHRSRSYRLTETGKAKAKELSRVLPSEPGVQS